MVEKRKYDVISIGSATLDIFVKSNQFKVVEDNTYDSGLGLCEAYGAKIEVEDMHMASGGGGTNTAVSFARKGLKAGVIAEMGKDLPAQTILHELSDEGVDTSMMVQEGTEKTAVSVIMTSFEGGRSIITFRGASAMLQEKDIDWDKINAKWLYVTSLGGQLDLLRKLVEFADEKGSNPYMMTSFVDGTKSMIEMACLSNATGLLPDIRGMHGPRADIKELTKILIPKKDGGILEKTGVVDFVKIGRAHV